MIHQLKILLWRFAHPFFDRRLTFLHSNDGFIQVALKITIKSAEVTPSGGAQQQQQQQQQQHSALEGFKGIGTRYPKRTVYLQTRMLTHPRLKRASTGSIDPFCILLCDGVEVPRPAPLSHPLAATFTSRLPDRAHTRQAQRADPGVGLRRRQNAVHQVRSARLVQSAALGV